MKEQIAEFQETLPRDITLYNITDQSKVVDDAVMKFLSELAIAVVAVIIVVMLLLPMRVALVSAGTIPITIFISLGLFMACGLELNCITLCVLILSLGMVVDNCIVIIDSYLEKLGLLPQDLPREEYDRLRREASIDSARHFFRSIFSATLAISVTFFPILFTVTGMPLDFLESFPWAISIVLFTSLLVAELLVPYLQYTFIKNPLKPREKEHGENIQMQTGRLTWKKHTTPSMLDLLQRSYNKVIGWCFRHTKTTLTLGIGSVLLGILLMGSIPQKLMPIAERNQFAVEIYLPSGTSLEKTSMIADSLERMMRRDPRVLSVASFHGSGSPRFQFSYAPQMGGTNFAQFIVNTPSNDDTVDMLDEFQDLYADYFPEAYVRFKQMSYSEAVSPLEVRLTGSNLDHLRLAADSIQTVLRQWPELKMVRSNLNEPRPTNHIALREDYSTRLGLTNIGNVVGYALSVTSGDGYDGMRTVYDIDGRVLSNRAGRTRPTRKMRPYIWLNVLMAAFLVAGTWFAAHLLLQPERKPFVEVTVYGTGGVNSDGVLPPWNVKGTPIDGGYVYMLPAKDRKAVDEIRTVLGGMETLHEKRGKPLTYDLLSLFLLKGDDQTAIRRTISEFMGEGFPVRIRADGPTGLKVATLNPRGLRKKLERVFSVAEQAGVTPTLTLAGRGRHGEKKD